MYLSMYLCLVLWLRGIVPITARQASCDDVYEGIPIAKDTIIHFPTLVINMSSEIWGPDAMEFNPDRWDRLKDVPPTQFFTFQHGTWSPLPHCMLLALCNGSILSQFYPRSVVSDLSFGRDLKDVPPSIPKRHLNAIPTVLRTFVFSAI
jgi:Cytochrome P450